MATSEEQPGQAVHEKPYQLQEIIRARPTGFDCNSPRTPYLKFTLGPGQLTRLIVRIWSHDQGRADTTSSLNPYADSNTWFALGVIHDDEEPDLYEFQRNVRASFDIRCHTHEWNLGVPLEDDEEMNDVQAWIESLAFMEDGEIGIFPLARYPGWTNLVWRMEAEIYSHLTDENDKNDRDETAHQASAHSTSVVKLELEETVHILRQLNELANQLADLQIRDPETMSNSLVPRVSGIPGGFHPMQLRKLDMVAKEFATRAKATSNITDLDNAIFIEKQALTGMTPAWGQAFETCLKFVADMAWERYRLSQSLPHLHESIRHTTRILESIPEHAATRQKHVRNLITSLDRLLDEKEKSSCQADVVAVTRATLTGVFETDSDYHEILHMLGSGLFTKFEKSKKLDDLDEAIAVARMALEATPLQHPKKIENLKNIGFGLRHRFSLTQEIADNDATISHSRDALEITPTGEDRELFLQHVAQGLEVRFHLVGAIADLEEAIGFTKELISILGEHNPRNVRRLNVLGRMYAMKFGRTQALEDIESAIRVGRLMIELTPYNDESRADRLLNLATILNHRAKLAQNARDLDEAINLGQEALAISSDDHEYRCAQLNNVGNLLGERFLMTGELGDLDQCIEYIRDCIEATPAVDQKRLNTRRLNLGARLDLRFSTTSQAADRDEARSCLRFASEAAAIALNDDQSPVTAIELLETGRGVLASFFHDRRTDLSLLEGKHPQLARSFIELRAELDKPTYNDVFGELESFDDPSSQLRLPDTDQRHKASIQMAALLVDIRTQPEQSRIHVLDLPELTRDDVLRRADDVRSFKTLIWLWDSVVGPVLDHLSFSKHCIDYSWPHVIWIPTGPLVRFPMHAAGYHLAPGHKTAMDRVISSYSSSVKAVMISRQQRYHEFGSDVVLIGMGETPGLPHSNLRHATTEIDVVRGVFNSTSLNCVQPASIKKDVLAALETCRIFHFAGHGESNRLDPLKSHILLDDWMTQPLTTASLMEKDLASSPPFLAYLSACKTSENSNQDLVDENIHLTSAFQLSGFRHVIGTL
ncbi:TPR domain-containing protein [Colletotrichum chrysophilum]|uniref:TPR domain-containing protein n=1 Tax=Colletotrichum chrysophilum TaxID=1836956 RepID=A0AAD9B175_9PEZI|nr:TPR domain-containing protein [Colletotrichum chrysophilum]